MGIGMDGASAAAAGSGAFETGRRPRICVIGSVEGEIAIVKERMLSRATHRVGSLEIAEGVLAGVPTIACACGSGKVAAAMATQACIDLCEPTHVINAGTAGALEPGLVQGDIVIADCSIEHDLDVTPLGYKPGENPDTRVVEIPTDPWLSELLEQAARKVASDFGRAGYGLVATGDSFVTAGQKARILSLFPSAACAEMEGAAIGRVCAANGIPYAIVRALSDSADGDAPMDYRSFEERAAETGAAIVAEAIREIAGL